MYITSLQRGVIKALVSANKPLTLREIVHSLTKRPCARKLIPQIFQLNKEGIIECIKNSENVMEIEYIFVPEWTGQLE